MPCTAFCLSGLRGPFFISACWSSALEFLFLLQLWKVCLFHSFLSPQCSRFLCASPSDSGSEVTLFKDRLGSEFSDFYEASYLLWPEALFIPHFLPTWSLLLVWAFPRSLGHTHRFNLLIGAIKSSRCNKRFDELPHSARKLLLGFVGVAVYLDKSPLGSNCVRWNEWLVCLPRSYFLGLIMYMTIQHQISELFLPGAGQILQTLVCSPLS